MYFYEVWVRSRRFRGDGALTYQSDQKIPVGSIVKVRLQNEVVPAIVVEQVAKPSFKCKDIQDVYGLPPLPAASLQLLSWLKDYYPSPIGPLAQLVLPANLPTTVLSTRSKAIKLKKISLNPEQSQVTERIKGVGSFVLHGRTGSGKTRIYAQLAAKAVEQGRSALVLSPEIGLTPQLAFEIEQLTGQPVLLFHSKMTPKERSAVWSHALTSRQPVIVVGPRSVLFAPVTQIGLIVLDEFHEPAYKQEQQPYYFAPRVAAKLAELHGAQLVLGSATPSVNEYYLAEVKKRPILRLESLAVGGEPKVTKILVDARDRSNFGQSALLSTQLIDNIRHSLTASKQCLLFLNRRGTARLVLCRVCGWQALCPNCDLPLTFHGDKFKLICHTCGYTATPMSVCPQCGNSELDYRSAGTKAIADEINRLLPEARVGRFDTDNLKADSLAQRYAEIKSGELDVVIGTQMIGKGLDLPKLATLGVLAADSSLGIPDFTARERTFQLLSQVLGRIGRGHTDAATAIIQTYQPDDPTTTSALSDDWASFYNNELNERRKFLFPPFCYLLKINCRRAAEKAAILACNQIKQMLEKKYAKTAWFQINGPAPAFHEKAAGKFEWQLLIKAKNRKLLTAMVADLPKNGVSYDIDPVNLV